MPDLQAGSKAAAALGGDGPRGSRLLTVGHGTASAEEFGSLLSGAGVQLLVDVRSAPGSRRFPQFGRAELSEWLPGWGIAYRWERGLGGFRKASPSSPNVALRHPSFRAYADYMATATFRAALAGLIDEMSGRLTAIMCAETLWWRCHRRLIADAAVVLCEVQVWHLGHDGRLSAHRLTEGVRRSGSGLLVYDVVGDMLPESAAPSSSG